MNDPGQAVDQDSDETVPLDLARRIAASSWLLGVDTVGPTRILVGAVPDGLAIEVPIPPGARIVGSVLLPDHDWGEVAPDGQIQSTGEACTVYLDADGAVADVLAFYDAALVAIGWSAPPAPSFLRAPGLHPSVRAALSSSRAYCGGPTGPSLHVAGRQAVDGRLDVHVVLRPVDRTTCSPPQLDHAAAAAEAADSMRAIWRVTPRLEAPPGVNFHRVSGSGNETVWRWLTGGKASIPLDAVVRHYARQMQAADWQELEDGRDGGLAWNRWRRDDEGRSWWAELWVIAGPHGQEYWVRLTVRSDHPDWELPPE